MRALEIVEGAGVADARRIIADFAAGGFVKSYALSIEMLDARGDGTVVLGSKIPKTMWKRIVQTGRGADVWSSGTVHLAGAAIITGITFKPDSINWLIAHHTDSPQPSRDKRTAPSICTLQSLVSQDEGVAEAGTLPKRRPADPTIIKPGALVATVAEAQTALGYSRGTIMKLIDKGKLKRVDSDQRAVRITVESVRAVAGLAG